MQSMGGGSQSQGGMDALRRFTRRHGSKPNYPTATQPEVDHAMRPANSGCDPSSTPGSKSSQHRSVTPEGLSLFHKLGAALIKMPRADLMEEAEQMGEGNLFRFYFTLLAWERDIKGLPEDRVRLMTFKLISMFVESGSRYEVDVLKGRTRRAILSRKSGDERFLDAAKCEVAYAIRNKLREHCPLSLMAGMDDLLL